MKQTILYYIFLMLPYLGIASDPNKNLSFGAGFGIKANICNKTTYSNYKISFGFGAMQKIFLDNDGSNAPYLIPAYQIFFDFYKGGMGSSALPSLINDIHFDFINSFSLSLGANCDYPLLRPFYSFSTNQSVLLHNDRLWSVTLASNIIFNARIATTPDRQSKYTRRNQNIGFVGIAYRDLQVGYYNDGTPFQWLGLGDNYDRWWTGGGFAHLGNDKSLANFIFHFDKFTGFNRAAFEYGNILSLDKILYADVAEATYNKSVTGFKCIFKNDAGISFTLSDFPSLDIQNRIHYGRKQPFHPPILKHLFYYGLFYAHTYEIK